MRWAVNCSQWTPSKQEWLRALSCVQREEVDRVSRFLYQRDCKLALVGRLLIRAALCSLLELTNDRILLTRSEKGKPLLIRDSCVDNRVAFNISHQGDYAVLAAEKVTHKQQGTLTADNISHETLGVSVAEEPSLEGFTPAIGVDVMKVSQPRGTTLSEFFGSMRKQFTVKEWQQIEQSAATQQLSNFYRFWCLKECFIKAEGSGLSYGLQNLEFLTHPNLPWPPRDKDVYEGTQLFVKGKLCREWRFQESMINPEHCVAVATNLVCTPSPAGFIEVTVGHLLRSLTPARPPEEAGHLWTHLISKQYQFIS